MSEPKLPEDYRFGLVTARAIRAVGDMGPEDDPYPDGPPVKLDRAVTFTPADRWRLVPGDPSQRVIQEAIVADFDADGYLSLHGQRGLWLYHGLWHVRFADELGWDGIDIQVTADHTQDHPLDLWTAAGYVPAPSVTVTTLLVPATVADGDVLIREGDHVTGVPQTRFIGPAGPRGARGGTWATGSAVDIHRGGQGATGHARHPRRRRAQLGGICTGGCRVVLHRWRRGGGVAVAETAFRMERVDGRHWGGQQDQQPGVHLGTHVAGRHPAAVLRCLDHGAAHRLAGDPQHHPEAHPERVVGHRRGDASGVASADCLFHAGAHGVQQGRVPTFPQLWWQPLIHDW
nr:MAG TPA: hypothetical protein [Caudoviricetes sp.]